MAVFHPAGFQCSIGVEEILHAVNRPHTGKGLAVLVAEPLASGLNRLPLPSIIMPVLNGRYYCFVSIVNAGSVRIYCNGMGDRQSVVGGFGKVCKDDYYFLTGGCVVGYKLSVAIFI